MAQTRPPRSSGRGAPGASAALAGEAAAQGERAERIAIEAELQQVRGQSKEREAELAALRAQLVTPERAEKRGR